MNKKENKQSYKDSNLVYKGVGQVIVQNKLQINDLLGFGKIAEEIRKFIVR